MCSCWVDDPPTSGKLQCQGLDLAPPLPSSLCGVGPPSGHALVGNPDLVALPGWDTVIS